MDCERYAEWIARRVDGTLREAETRELEEHLRHCGRCRAEILIQTRLAEALAEAPPSGLSSDFTRRVSERALGLDLGAKRRLRWTDLAPSLALAGLAAAALVLVPWLSGPVADAFLESLSRLGEGVRFTAGGGDILSSTALLLTALAGLCATWAFRQVHETLTELERRKSRAGQRR